MEFDRHHLLSGCRFIHLFDTAEPHSIAFLRVLIELRGSGHASTRLRVLGEDDGAWTARAPTLIFISHSDTNGQEAIVKPVRTLAFFLALILPAAFSRLFAQPRFEVPFTITDGRLSWSMYFGILPGANYCMADQDTINGHGEWEQPPVPPGPLEAWFVWPRSGSNVSCFGMGILNDYRPFTSYAQKDTFRINAYYMSDSASLVVSWPPGLVAYFNELILKDVQTGGALHTVNMLTTTSVSLSVVNPPHFRIYASGPHDPNDTVSINVQLHAGWNVISNPFDHPLPDSLARHLFATLLDPRVIGYTMGYVWSDVMVKGRGYWGRFPGPHTVTIRGTGHTSDSISVSGSWNLIGPPAHPVPVASVYSIPPNIIASRFFEVGSGYSKADTLWPGRGYYVKMLQSGLLVLPDGF
jgi:hypothetical protein